MLLNRGVGEGEVRGDVCVKLWFEVWRLEKKIFHRRPDYNTDKVRSFAWGRITPPSSSHIYPSSHN